MIPLGEFVKLDQRQYMQQPLGYPESRYIMMYLYSKGLLKKWYDAYVAGYKDDSTGGKALESVLGKNLDEIEKDFAAYVTALKPVPQPYLGLATSVAPGGLKVTGVAPGSGAFDAGVKVGDLVTKVDGKRMVYRDTLTAHVAGLAVGGTVQVQFRRDGKDQAVTATLKDASTAPKQLAADSAPVAEQASAAPAGTAVPTGKQEAPPAQPAGQPRVFLGVRFDDNAVVQTVVPRSRRCKGRLTAG